MQLYENIKFFKGRFWRLPYHESRMRKSIEEVWGSHFTINLRRDLVVPLDIGDGFYVCTIVYDTLILDIQYSPQALKPIKSLRLIELESSFDYPYKYINRSSMEDAFAKRKEADDVLLVRRGEILETTAANVALLQAGKWYTPARPLMEGTQRNFLIDQEKIIPRVIKSANLNSYEKIKVFNSLIEWDEAVEIEISDIQRSI